MVEKGAVRGRWMPRTGTFRAWTRNENSIADRTCKGGVVLAICILIVMAVALVHWAVM